MQLSFSRLWDGYATDKDAMNARNERAKEFKAKGYSVSCSCLRNQLKPYDGLLKPNGSVCNVYLLTYNA